MPILPRFAAILLSVICSTQSLATTWHVSPAGDDSAAGSPDSPLKTISAAAEKTAPGDVVLVYEGVYRERVAPPRGGEPGRPIVYRAEPGKRVIVKGSEQWSPEWRAEGNGIYSAHPDHALFNDKSPEYVDHHNPFKVELSSTPWGREGRREWERKQDGDKRIGKADRSIVYTCGQLFVEGHPYREAPLREELEEGDWWYDAKQERVFAHFGDLDPAKQLVELTTRRRLFAPKKRGLGHIVVEGFIFEHSGNQYPTNFWSNDAYAQKGAVGIEAGHDWIIRNNVIRYAKAFALDVGRVDRHSKPSQSYNNRVENNYILDNGSAGILSNGSINLVIKGNVILRNNRLRFEGVKRWEQAGIKCHHFDRGLIANNYIAHNYATYGVWLDNQFPDSRVTRNFIYANGGAGVFLEMSDYDYDRLLVDNNLLLANRDNAVYIHDASGGTFIHNLMANTTAGNKPGQAVYIRQVTQRTRSYHHKFLGNLLLSNTRNVDVNYPAFRAGEQHFDFNLYNITPNELAFSINRSSDQPRPWSPEEFIQLVGADTGVREWKPEAIKDQERVWLTHEQWRKFWNQHGVRNDASSHLTKEAQVSYDPAEHRLTLMIDAEPQTVRLSEHVAGIDQFPATSALPPNQPVQGPFPALKRGKNEFIVWSGLPVLEEGELPAVDWR